MAPESREDFQSRIRELEERLAEAEETLRALRSGEVDGIVASGPDGERIYTLAGADEAYRVMVEGMAEGALTLTLDGLILFSNERFAGMVCRPLERVIGARIQDFAVPGEEASIAVLLSGSGSRKVETRLTAEGASQIPVYLSVEKMALDSVESLCVIVTDLSEQKRSEQILAEERLARSILEQAAEAILVVDPQGRIIRASRTADHLAGVPVTGRSFDQVYCIRVGGPVYPYSRLLQAACDRSIHNVEATAETCDGRVSQLLVGAAVLTGSGAGLLGCVVNLTDITERTLAEATLHASQRRNRLLAEMLERADQPFGLGYTDGGVGTVNAAFERLTGYNREELQQINWATGLTAPEWHQAETAALAELHSTGAPVRYEKEYLRKDGARVPVEMLVHLANDHEGRQIYYCFVTDLTGRKLVEEERARTKRQIETERELLETIVANSPAGITLVRGSDLTFQMANRAYQAYVPGRQIVGRKVEEVWPEFSPHMERIFREVLETGEPRSAVDARMWVGRTAEGSREERYASWLAIRVMLPGDQGWGLLSFSVETTESVLAREALRRYSEWLRVTLNSIGDAVLATDSQENITLLNPVAAQLTGWTEAEAIGRPARSVFRIVTEDTHEEADNIVGRVLREGKHISLANQAALVNREGREIPIEDSAAPILDSDGKALGAVLVFHDVTEKRRAQRALQEQTARLRLALAASGAGTWEWDLGTNRNIWSEELWKVYGLEPHSCEPSYDAWLQVILPEDRPQAVHTVQEAARNGTGMQLEFRVRDSDGTVRWLMSLGSPIRDHDGRVLRMLGIVVDITERNRLEQQRLELLSRELTLATEKALRETEAELARVARGLAVGELAASIAHEVNQPLVGVVTNAEACLRWLGGKTPNLHEARESLALIVRDGNRASGIIRRIREFTRKGGQMSALLPLDEVIQEAAAFAQGELLRRKVTLRLKLSGDLPPVRGDRIQLQQVLLNLLINGAEAMDGCDGPKELVVSSEPRVDSAGEASVHTAVRDRGNGISPEDRNRMFDAFFTTKPSGMGMGLSISRSIVEAHGGRIWAEANVGGGLTVQFSLPADSGKSL